ncbi:endonuclease domain-containing protein [Nakamurella alba]|nr:DUF559 domain-containing protein [Nakamurella alba]
MRTQDGLIGRAQAVRCGMTERQIDYRVRVGTWVQVRPSVYRSAVVEPSMRSAIRATALWAGSPSAISGWAAAWWWGCTDLEPPMITLIIPRNRHLRAQDGIAVVRRDYPIKDVVRVKGIAVVPKTIAALDGAVEMGEQGVEMFDRALLRGLPLDLVAAAHDEWGRRRGSPAATRLLATAADGAHAESERICHRLLRAAGITGWQINPEVRLANATYLPDLAFLRQRVAIEIDGWAFHSDPERFEKDRWRQNAFMVAGWTVLRYTWYQLTRSPEQVVAEISTAVLRSSVR